MSCEKHFRRQEGYIKREVFTATVQEEVPIGGNLPIAMLAAECIVLNIEIPFMSADIGVLSVGLYTNDLTSVEIIPKLVEDITTTTGATYPISKVKVDTGVKPVGMTTTLATNDLGTIVRNVLGEATSTIGSEIVRTDELVLWANSYIIGIKSTAKIPVDTELAFVIEYQGTV